MVARWSCRRWRSRPARALRVARSATRGARAGRGRRAMRIVGHRVAHLAGRALCHSAVAARRDGTGNAPPRAQVPGRTARCGPRAAGGRPAIARRPVPLPVRPLALPPHLDQTAPGSAHRRRQQHRDGRTSHQLRDQPAPAMLALSWTRAPAKPCCRQASNNATATALDRFRLRLPGAMGR